MDPPEVKLGIDEYSDVTMLAKPVIYISVKEICSTHSVRRRGRGSLGEWGLPYLLLQHGFWEGGGAAVISLSGGGWG